MKYKSLVRFGNLEEKVEEVSETTYELFDAIKTICIIKTQG